MTEDARRITSGRDFEVAMFPRRARERDQAARRDAEARARELGESLAHEHLQGLVAIARAPHRPRVPHAE